MALMAPANPGAYISSSSGSSWGRTLTASILFFRCFLGGRHQTGGGSLWRTNLGLRSIPAAVGAACQQFELDGGGIVRRWEPVACGGQGGALYVSYNFGTNWAMVNSGVTAQWTAVASSADGSRLMAVDSTGDVYISTDSGVTWAQRLGLPAASWTAWPARPTAAKLVLVANGNQIYTSSQGSTTAGTTGYLIGSQTQRH